MGCDIHLYVEVRGADGTWQSADEWERDTDDGYTWVDVPYEKEYYNGRNYSLFAMLADVRNRDGLIPFSQPRGLPADVSAIVKEASDSWDSDGHSHSYFTAAELMAFDWTQVMHNTGFAHIAEYYEWARYDKGKGEGPKSYSGGVWGQNVRHIAMEDADAIIKALSSGVDDWRVVAERLKATHQHDYVAIEWDVPYYKAARYFLSDTMPRLWALGKPDDVRIVFWFDN